MQRPGGSSMPGSLKRWEEAGDWSGMCERGEEKRGNGWSHHVSSGYFKGFSLGQDEKELESFQERGDMMSFDAAVICLWDGWGHLQGWKQRDQVQAIAGYSKLKVLVPGPSTREVVRSDGILIRCGCELNTG